MTCWACGSEKSLPDASNIKDVSGVSRLTYACGLALCYACWWATQVYGAPAVPMFTMAGVVNSSRARAAVYVAARDTPQVDLAIVFAMSPEGRQWEVLHSFPGVLFVRFKGERDANT